jgi:uncharacterized protein YidB (DUF937 family)
MGLMDVLNGLQNGPHGQPTQGSGSSSSGGGMSPITMAILGLLAYKAMKGFGGSQPGAIPSGTGRSAAPFPPAGSTTGTGMPGATGGLGDLLRGGLGGLLAGGAAGSVLGGGLNDLLKQFKERGLGDTVNSWVGTGPNKPVAPNDLAHALGADQINALTAQTGLSRDELLNGLSQSLPQVVDQLTPHGQVPQEISV